MNKKAFISLDTVISIFLLSMILIITKNTNDLLNIASSKIYNKRQEIEVIDKLLMDISLDEALKYKSTWTSFSYDNKKIKIRKTEDNKDFIKTEIRIDRDNNYEKTYEKIILK